MTNHAITTTTYDWTQDSLVKKVIVREQNDDSVAYIYANDQADAAQLSNLRAEFEKKGWAVSPDNRHGAGIRVNGYGNENELFEFLTANKSTSGEPKKTNAIASVKKQSASDAIRSHSLRGSGIFYSIGNALFIMSGIKRGNDKAQIGTGLSFAVGDAALMAFGGRDDERQFKSLLRKLEDHLHHEGVEIPQGSAISAETLAKDNGLLEKTYDFMHEHINAIKIAAEVVGGGLYFKAGMNQQNPRKTAAGAVIVGGWLAALLIKEKKLDKEEWNEADPLHKAQMYIQEKPLRLAGWAGLTHNALSTIGAFEERAKLPGSSNYKWDLAGISAMLVANSLYSISNKSTGGSIETDELVQDVYGLAAQMLAKQPEEVREAALESTASFLGERSEIKDKKPEILTKLRKEVDLIANNPWFPAHQPEHAAQISR